jgi:hypothetical protein
MKRFVVFLCCLSLLVVVCKNLTAVPPELPSGAKCMQGVGFDADHNNVIDTCPGASVWTTSGSDFVVNFSAGSLTSKMQVVTDTASPSGNYVQLLAGTDELPLQQAMFCKSDWLADTYALSLTGALLQPANPYAFVSWDTPINPYPADNKLAWILFGGANTPNYTTVAWNRAGTIANFQAKAIGTDGLTQTLTAGRHCLFVSLPPGAKYASLRMTPGSSLLPTQYIIKKISGAPTSCADTRFANANVLPMTGFNGSTGSITTPDVRYLWDSTHLYVCAVMTDPNLCSTAAGNDLATIFNDGLLEMVWRQGTSRSARDATTFKVAVNQSGLVYDANYPNAVADITYSALSSPTVVLTGTNDCAPGDTSWQVFAAMNLGFTAINSTQFVMDTAIHYWGNSFRSAFSTASNNLNNPVGWGVATFDPTVITGGGPTDSAGPSIDSITVPSGNITQISAQVSVALSDAFPSPPLYAQLAYGPSSGTYTTGTLPYRVCNAGVCLFTLNNLVAGTTYHFIVTAKDAATNTTTSSDQTFTTAAQTGAKYVSPTGSDAADGSSGTPWLTVKHAVSQASAGNTIYLKDGTYPPIAIDCSGASVSCHALNAPTTPASCPPGAAGNPITITSQNDRIGVVASLGDLDAISINSCPYYTVSKLHVTVGDKQNSSKGNGITITNSTSAKVLGNLIDGNNRYYDTNSIKADAAQGITIEGNELYNFHSDGIKLISDTRNAVIRFNYCNSRGRADLNGATNTAGQYPALPFKTPNTGIGEVCVYFTGSGWSLIANNIDEGDAAVYKNYPASTVAASGDNNKILGNISLNGQNGTSTISGPAVGTSYSAHNEQFTNNVTVGSVFSGMFLGHCKDCRVDNNSVFLPGPTGIRILGTGASGDPLGSRTSGDNDVIVMSPSSTTGFDIAGQIEPWGFDYPFVQQVLTQQGYNPGNFDSHFTNVSLLSCSLGFGACYLTSANSTVHNAGKNNADPGAKVLYQYDATGTITTTPLWDAADGYKFIPRGATITGVNDTASDSLVGFEQRIHAGTADAGNICTFPY